MQPINDFHRDVKTLKGQGDIVDDIGVLSMSFGYAGPVLVSCWRVSWRDLIRMLWARRLWLVVKGDSFPPLFIETDKKYAGINEYRKRHGE